MPGSSGERLHDRPPGLFVSEPSEEAGSMKPSGLATRRTPTGPGLPGRALEEEEEEESSSSEWDDDEEQQPQPPRRTAKPRDSRSPGDPKVSSSSSDPTGPRTESNDGGRYSPQLSRIPESAESTVSSRSSVRSGASSARKRTEQATPLLRKSSNDVGSVQRGSARQQNAGAQRRQVAQKPQVGHTGQARTNPSLLPALSNMADPSDRSSEGNPTVAQSSYSSRRSSSPPPFLRPEHDNTRSVTPTVPGGWHHEKPRPDVFDFLQPASVLSGHDDDRSAVSSSPTSNSSYQSSEAGSSESPGTPSSRSTFPSPTSIKRARVAELRKKYDSASVVSAASVATAVSTGSEARSPAQPSVSPVPEDDGESDDERPEPSERSFASHAGTAYGSEVPDWRYQQQQAQLHQQVADAQHADPGRSRPRSRSSSSRSTDYAAWAQQQVALQHYQHSSAMSPAQYMATTPQPVGATVDRVQHQPTAPSPPDLTQRTIVGYEKLALALAAPDSSVKPVYRKFGYLNHRILLHLQDEICEMEEELRMLDEIIAQWEVQPVEQSRPPASRRAETRFGGEIHHRRRALLGRIFLKTEQYNRAMTSYAKVCKSSAAAGADEIAGLKAWLDEHRPIHEVETMFLDRHDDLVQPGETKSVGSTGVTVVNEVATADGLATATTTTTTLDGPPLPNSNFAITFLFAFCGVLVGLLIRS